MELYRIAFSLMISVAAQQPPLFLVIVSGEKHVTSQVYFSCFSKLKIKQPIWHDLA